MKIGYARISTSQQSLDIQVKALKESAYTASELDTYDKYLDAIRVEQTIRQDSYETIIKDLQPKTKS